MTKKAKPPPPERKSRARDELVEAARELIAEADALLTNKTPPTERFRAAVDKVRSLVPEAAPPPPTHAKPRAPLTQASWDEHVLEWALQVDTPITVERAVAALAPDAGLGSSEHSAIAASLKRLPRDRFTVSWYMANTALAPKWTKQSK